MRQNQTKRSKPRERSSDSKREARPKPRIPRTERLEARLNPQQKDLISRAAQLEDETVSGYVVRESVKAATRRILEEEQVTLTQNDRAALVKALLHPPRPSAALRSAYKKYQEELAS